MSTYLLVLQSLVAPVARRLTRDERGATAVEYGLMVALIAVVIIAGVAFLGNSVNTQFERVGRAVASPSP